MKPKTAKNIKVILYIFVLSRKMLTIIAPIEPNKTVQTQVIAICVVVKPNGVSTLLIK